MNKNGKRKFGKSVLMCGMSGVMAFGMIFAPVSMGASGGATQVKAATTTASIGSSSGSGSGLGTISTGLEMPFVGYQKTTKTTSKKPTKTSTKKSKLSKNYTKKTTKKTTATNTKTSYRHDSTKDVTTVTKTVTTTTKVYYKKTLTTTVKTDVTVTTTTTSYVRSGSPNLSNYIGFSDNYIPIKIVSAMNSDKIKVSLNSGLGSEGVFSPSNKTIQVKHHTDKAIMHEIGHYVNYKKGYVTNGSEFQSIFKAEKAKYRGFYSEICMKFSYGNDLGQYGRTNASEYFAECFRDYYFSKNSRSRLKSNCPRTYQFIEKTVKNF